MNKYLITINYKNITHKLDNTTIETQTPLSDLRKLLPEYNIVKGNSGNWNILLYDIETKRHLYYKIYGNVQWEH